MNESERMAEMSGVRCFGCHHNCTADATHASSHAAQPGIEWVATRLTSAVAYLYGVPLLVLFAMVFMLEQSALPPLGSLLILLLSIGLTMLIVGRLGHRFGRILPPTQSR